MTHEGGCACGDIRYRLTDAPVVVNCCHCRDCQTITGSAFAINAMIETDRIEVIKGGPVMRRLERGARGDTHAWRCGRCDTLLYADHPMFGGNARFVRVGTLDDGAALPIDAHYFLQSKHPWIAVPDDVGQFETLPTDGVGVDLGPARQDRLAAMFA